MRAAAVARGICQRQALVDPECEELLLPVWIAHGRAQALIRAIVRAQRVAVHHEHGLSVEGQNHGIG